MYDINYMLGVIPGEVVCKTWQFLDVVGGLSSTLWSNILGGCVLHIALRVRSANIAKRFPKFLIIGALFPLSIALLQVGMDVIEYDGTESSCQYEHTTEGYVVRGLYYWSRMLSIIVNIIIYISITVRINSMVMSSTGNKYEALTELAARMKYYPLFQALSRSGAAWDEFDRTGESGYFPSSLMRSVCSPSSGIWYFLIFVVMHPGMKSHLRDIFRENMCCCLPSWLLAKHSEDNLSILGGVLSTPRDRSIPGAGRVSLTGSMLPSDGHRQASRSMFKSGDGSLVLNNNESGDMFSGASVDRRYSYINELDEDDLESLITSGTDGDRTERASSRRTISTATK